MHCFQCIGPILSKLCFYFPLILNLKIYLEMQSFVYLLVIWKYFSIQILWYFLLFFLLIDFCLIALGSERKHCMVSILSSFFDVFDGPEYGPSGWLLLTRLKRMCSLLCWIKCLSSWWMVLLNTTLALLIFCHRGASFTDAGCWSFQQHGWMHLSNQLLLHITWLSCRLWIHYGLSFLEKWTFWSWHAVHFCLW